MENAPIGKRCEFAAAYPLLLAADIRKTVEYYQDVLGFGIKAINGNPPGYAIVERGKAAIHFMPASAPEQMRPNHRANPHASDIYIHVSNIDALCEDFAPKEVRVIRGPETYKDGMREIVIEDCNGYYLCFAQEMP